jgi:hypothetical protein
MLRCPGGQRLCRAAAALLQRALAIGALALGRGLGVTQQMELAHGPASLPLAGCHDIAICPL